jgi:hypothetical protein
MSDFLETLKVRMADAQRRFNEVNLRFQKTQAEMQAIQQEFVSWQTAVKNETIKEQAELEAQTPDRPPNTSPAATLTVVPSPASEVNKTEMIKNLLQKNPAGLTPAEVWRAVKTTVPERSYVYSVLKRLKDREQVMVKKGKYYFRTLQRNEEGGPTVVVQ